MVLFPQLFKNMSQLMELNIINYILNKKKISQNELAEMLDPPVSKSILSKWKNLVEQIPKKRYIELRRIARIGKFKDGQNEEWLSITDNEKDADKWYRSMFEHISYRNTQEEYVWKNETYQEINYDSLWIENIQIMLITLNRAGVPIKKLDFTFEPLREVIWPDDQDEEDSWPISAIYTDADNLIIPYIRAYSGLREWVMYNVTYINDKSLSELQFDFVQRIPEIALSHIDKKLFKAVGTNMNALDKLVEESQRETRHLIADYSKKAPLMGINYFNFLSQNLTELGRETVNSPTYIEKYGSEDRDTFSKHISKDTAEEIKARMESETEILDGIKENKKLLEEILEKLNNLTNKGESK
jgi:hypothetical protein